MILKRDQANVSCGRGWHQYGSNLPHHPIPGETCRFGGLRLPAISRVRVHVLSTADMMRLLRTALCQFEDTLSLRSDPPRTSVSARDRACERRGRRTGTSAADEPPGASIPTVRVRERLRITASIPSDSARAVQSGAFRELGQPWVLARTPGLRNVAPVNGGSEFPG